MTGREENKLKTDNKTKEKLEKQPAIMKEYFIYLSNNGKDSAQTRRVFIASAIRFSNWLVDNGTNTFRVDSWKKITPGIINRYLLEIGENVKPKTKADYYIHLKLFFNFLKCMEYIDNSPFDSDKIPKQKFNYNENVVYLTKKEIEKAKESIRRNEGNNSLMYETIFTLAYKTGVRITALTEINIDDININEGIIKITDKENYTRDVYVGESTIDLIDRYLKYRMNLSPVKTNALFVSRKGSVGEYKRVSYHNVLAVIKSNTEFTGKHITPHKLRDTCAMLVYEKTHDIYLTGEVLGHRNIENTRKYAKVTEQRRRETASFLDKI